MRLLYLILGIVLITASCRKNKETANSICFTRTSTELIIKNDTNQEYYFTAFGQSILPLIDWAPLCDNNSIPAKGTVRKQLSSVTGYLDNDLLVVYWWKCTGNNPGETHTVVLDRNQTTCQ